MQAATGGRLALGIGLSHQIVVESMWGISFEKPVRHMREYLSVLVPLLEQGAVSYSGETIRTEAAIAQLSGHLGQAQVDDQVRAILRRQIADEEGAAIRKDLRHAPAWIAELLRALTDPKPST